MGLDKIITRVSRVTSRQARKRVSGSYSARLDRYPARRARQTRLGVGDWDLDSLVNSVNPNLVSPTCSRNAGCWVCVPSTHFGRRREDGLSSASIGVRTWFDQLVSS